MWRPWSNCSNSQLQQPVERLQNVSDRKLSLNNKENIKNYYDEETKIISMPDKKDVVIPSEGIGFMLFNSMKKSFGKIALFDIETNENYSYDDLFLHTVRTAIKLESLGIKPGDVISICSHNQKDAIATFISVCLIGAINASLDPSLTDLELEILIKQVEPKMFFVSPDCEKRIEEICAKLKIDARIVIYGDPIKNISYSEFNCPQSEENAFEPYIAQNIEETCMILFSSGSTGLAKALCYSHKYFGYHSNVSNVPSNLNLSTLYWIGAVQSLVMQIKNGCKYGIATTFDPCAIWNAIPKYNLTLLQMVPHVATEFITYKPKTVEVDLTYLAIVGNSISKESIIKIREAMPKTLVAPIYSMSETAQLLNPTCPKSYMKYTSAGVPVNGIKYKVVDPETEQNVGFNQKGELRVKSPYQFKGYYKRDSSECWDEEGFFKTGDIVYFDEDFSFFIVDRIKEMFRSKGVNITPVIYEKILEDHPDIDIAVIVGVPNAKYEYDIVAVVVPRKGSVITSKVVEEYYNPKVIDVAKITAGVKFMESVPLLPSGKISRKKLKEMIINEMK